MNVSMILPAQYRSTQDILASTVLLTATPLTVFVPDSGGTMSGTPAQWDIYLKLPFVPAGENRVSILSDGYKLGFEDGEVIPFPEVSFASSLTLYRKSPIDGAMVPQPLFSAVAMLTDDIMQEAFSNHYTFEQINLQGADANLTLGPDDVLVLGILASDTDFFSDNQPERLLITTGLPNGQRAETWGPGWLETREWDDDEDTTPPGDDLPVFAQFDAPTSLLGGGFSWSTNPISIDDDGDAWRYRDYDGPGVPGFAASGGGGPSGALEASRATTSAMGLEAARVGLTLAGFSNAATIVSVESFRQSLSRFVERIFDVFDIGLSGFLNNTMNGNEFDTFATREIREAGRDFAVDNIPYSSLSEAFSISASQSDITFGLAIGPGTRTFGDHRNFYLGALAADVVSFDGSKDDRAFGLSGDDTMLGGRGNDTLFGGQGNDHLEGSDGDDLLDGGTGADTLFGGNGDDRLDGGPGNATIYGGNGRDTIIGGNGDDFLYGGDTSTDLRDVIFGGDGNDWINAGWGNDEAHGGNGNDTIDGSFGSDTLIGNAGNDVISGGQGSDQIFCGPGNDFINGGFGYDRLNGGTGADTFFLAGNADHASDWIQDYNAAEGDVLQVGIAGATRAQFQVNMASTAGAGAVGIAESFVIYRPTGQILFALIDGAAQDSINLRIGGDVFDLLA